MLALHLTHRIHALFDWFPKVLTYMSATILLVSKLGLNTERRVDVNSVAQQQKRMRMYFYTLTKLLQLRIEFQCKNSTML